MVLLCPPRPATLPADVEAARPLIQQLTASAAAREHVRVLAASTYGRCVLGLAGFLTYATEHMDTFLRRANAAAEDTAVTVELLLLLSDTVVDEDNATFIAKLGAHPLLMRLMEHEDEEIQEAAAQVVGNCTASPSAISFPHRALQLEPPTRLWPRAVSLPLDPRDDTPKGSGDSDSKETKVVLIRQVPTRMTGQPKTGYLLWGAAFVLARWVHLHRDVFVGKTVIEVGSGLGLGGITAARYADRTVLTDYQSDTCTALEYNVQLNRPFTHELEPVKPDVTVAHLDWDLQESIEAVPKADVVIASDIICEPSTAEGFLRVVRHHVLGCGAVTYLMNANSHSRFGVTHLHALLTASTDLVYSITPVQELSDGAQLLDTVSDAQEISYEFYEIRAATTNC